MSCLRRWCQCICECRNTALGGVSALSFARLRQILLAFSVVYANARTLSRNASVSFRQAKKHVFMVPILRKNRARRLIFLGWEILFGRSRQQRTDWKAFSFLYAAFQVWTGIVVRGVLVRELACPGLSIVVRFCCLGIAFCLHLFTLVTLLGGMVLLYRPVSRCASSVNGLLIFSPCLQLPFGRKKFMKTVSGDSSQEFPGMAMVKSIAACAQVEWLCCVLRHGQGSGGSSARREQCVPGYGILQLR